MGEAEKQDYVRMLDAMAEAARQEAAKLKNATHQKSVWGVVAGLEIAAALVRNTTTDLKPEEAAKLLAHYRETHYAYLVKKEMREVRKRPPNLQVKRVVKGKKEEK